MNGRRAARFRLGCGGELHCGDCRQVLPALAENSIDAICTDPPYHLVSIYKRFANEPRSVATIGNGPYGRHARGFMGQRWDGGDVAFDPETWKPCLRVLKPGGHMLVFGGTRTFHRMVTAVEAAGFEIRDTILWLYGQGFPKSRNIGKTLDRHAGAEREVIGQRFYGNGRRSPMLAQAPRGLIDLTAPATDLAKHWHGWGTALKPSAEFIVMARKPLTEPTIAGNVIRWGAGALNVDGCRVDGGGTVNPRGSCYLDTGLHEGWARPWMEDRRYVQRRHDLAIDRANTLGRWPSNVIHDGSNEVIAAFPDAPGQLRETGPQFERRATVYGEFAGVTPAQPRNDSGSAARFFYQAKADLLEEVVIQWIFDSEPHEAVLQVATGQSPERATVVSASADVLGWSTFLSGNTITDLFRKASTCTIRTATRPTIESRTWNYLTSLLTSACTAAVKYEMGNGGNHAANVGSCSQSTITITLSDTASLPGANHAASGTRLKISVSARESNSASPSRIRYASKADLDDRLNFSHPTIKPVDLLQYLIRLICPPQGIVLDPFAGTGTTGEAAWREGMQCILIEKQPEYIRDIRARYLIMAGGGDRRGLVMARERERRAGRNPDDPGPLFAAL